MTGDAPESADGALDRDVDVTARTLYGEARGQPLDGIIAVANVIVNRARRGAYGATPAAPEGAAILRDAQAGAPEGAAVLRDAQAGAPEGAAVSRDAQAGAPRSGALAAVCLRPWQFSCWNARDPNRAIIERVQPGTFMFDVCRLVASLAIRGLLHDPTGGATHYHTKGVAPDWSRGKTPSAVIGDHLFFNDID
jgi:N-acetylmuramoyl-L-alanine amidase